MDEKLRAIEGFVETFGLGAESGMRTEGIKNLRRIETAIVRCGRRALTIEELLEVFPLRDFGKD